MLVNILRDCGDMNIFKTLFVLGVELDFWHFFPIFLYCGFQNYKHRLIFLHYILSMWHFLTLLKNYSH